MLCKLYREKRTFQAANYSSLHVLEQRELRQSLKCHIENCFWTRPEKEEYNKPAKGFSAIIGYTWKKENLLKWSIKHHEKWHFFYGICSFNEDNEYSLYCKFSDTIAEGDKICVSQLVNYVAQRGNPFNTENYCMHNFATGSQKRFKILANLFCSRNKYFQVLINWAMHKFNTFVLNSWK